MPTGHRGNGVVLVLKRSFSSRCSAKMGVWTSDDLIFYFTCPQSGAAAVPSELLPRGKPPWNGATAPPQHPEL